MTSEELRARFLEFFRERGHAILPSASLIPENDPTTLFTGSGMQPLLPYLLGQSHPQGKRIANSQKSFRAEDIEEVGDNRHTTFFEMLGNWSFGDYWKEDQLTWFFEFLTKEIGIPKEKLWVTCFEGDTNLGIPPDRESAEIWKQLGIPEERIRFYSAKKNWWSRFGPPSTMPVGEPGGPDSEVFYEFTSVEHHPEFGETCHPNCDCGRFMEIGNSVFMEYKRTPSGFDTLAQRNVDFGGGLERITAAANDNPDIFQIDIFAAMSKVFTMPEEAGDLRRRRIVLDHIRASAHLIADGVEPSNKERGYVLRRLLRRAIFHVVTLTSREAKIPLDQRPQQDWDQRTSEVLRALIANVAGFYPTVKDQEDKVHEVISKEVGKFIDVLKSRSELEKTIRAFKGSEIPGETAFKLFSTYGPPIDYIKDEARKFGVRVDEAGFAEAFKRHQEISRVGISQRFAGGLADHSEQTVKLHTATHLLHAALRTTLGTHVEQRGSNITSERLRFDFTHPQKLSAEELRAVEDLINEQIRRDLPVTRTVVTPEDAKAAGALGLFGEKYGDQVSVYAIGDFSKEICGGPHVPRTGVIGRFRIAKEEGLAAGIRRIRAVVE